MGTHTNITNFHNKATRTEWWMAYRCLSSKPLIQELADGSPNSHLSQLFIRSNSSA